MDIKFEKKIIEAISGIIVVLKERDYPQIIKLPYMKGSIFSVINDLKFLFRKNDTIFESSFFYKTRRYTYNNELLILSDFFLHNKKETRANILLLLGSEDSVNNLVKLNILSELLDADSGKSLLKSNIRIIPFNGEYFISDPFDRTINNFVWIGKDSVWLADRLRNLPYTCKIGIDIGSGCGIQAITLSGNSIDKVIAIDINEKGLIYSKINSIINKKTNISFLKSDMLSSIRGEIDLIVSNPPFMFLPTNEEMTNRDGYGGTFGIEKTIRILEYIEQHLNIGGHSILLTFSPVIDGKILLVEKIKEILSISKGYSITYELIEYSNIKEYTDLYKSNNISYFVQGIIYISKNKNSSDSQFTIKDISKVEKFFFFVRITGRKMLTYVADIFNNPKKSS